MLQKYSFFFALPKEERRNYVAKNFLSQRHFIIKRKTIHHSTLIIVIYLDNIKKCCIFAENKKILYA